MEFTHVLESLQSFFPKSSLVVKDPTPMTCMILSPHPDDECISGALAIRLQKENNAHIVNIAVTLGSDKKRQKPRLKELANACERLDMELITLTDEWPKKLSELKSLIQKYQPQIIIAPHVNDRHPTHIKTAKLLIKALGTKTDCVVAWTEFWGQMEKPNALIEVPEEVLLDQMEALALHAGEVTRNPYHLRLPAWMMDNVRRGSEIVASVGGISPQFAYGVLYQVQKVKKGKFKDMKFESPHLSNLADLGEILKS